MGYYLRIIGFGREIMKMIRKVNLKNEVDSINELYVYKKICCKVDL